MEGEDDFVDGDGEGVGWLRVGGSLCGERARVGEQRKEEQAGDPLWVVCRAHG